MAAHQVEFQLAEARRREMAEVADPRHGRLLPQPHSPLPGTGHERFVVGDRESGAHARLLIDELALPGRDRDLLEDLLHELGHHDRPVAAELDARLLLDHLDALLAVAGVVGVDHRTDPVLELGNHLAGAVVGGGVRRKQQHHVDVKLYGIPANLHVPLFEDVEHPHLHEFVEFGQLVHGEDAAVHPRDQAEVKRLLARHTRAPREFRRIDLADDVGELRSRGEPFGVPLAAGPPGDRHIGRIPRGHEPPAGRRDRMEGVVMQRDRGIVEVRQVLVEKPHELPHQPALGLPLLAEEEHVVPGDQGDVDLGNHRVVVADDSGKEFVAILQHAEKVAADLILDTAALPAARPQVRKRGRQSLAGHTTCLPCDCPF